MGMENIWDFFLFTHTRPGKVAQNVIWLTFTNHNNDSHEVLLQTRNPAHVILYDFVWKDYKIFYLAFAHGKKQKDLLSSIEKKCSLHWGLSIPLTETFNYDLPRLTLYGFPIILVCQARVSASSSFHESKLSLYEPILYVCCFKSEDQSIWVFFSKCTPRLENQ